MKTRSKITYKDFSSYLFWDVDKSTIDFNKYPIWLIERVLLRGAWEDFMLIIDYYGRERVGQLAKDIRYLDEKTMYFCSSYFNIPISEMRCYIMKQSSPSHWDY